MKKIRKTKEHGRIRLPRGKTANERAIRTSLGTHFVAAKRGPLESLVLKDHCEMCGANNSLPAPRPWLEPAFNPSGEPMTLCRDCRIGSAELLAERKGMLFGSSLATVLAALHLFKLEQGPDGLPIGAGAKERFGFWFTDARPLQATEIDALCERLNLPDDNVPDGPTRQSIRARWHDGK